MRFSHGKHRFSVFYFCEQLIHMYSVPAEETPAACFVALSYVIHFKKKMCKFTGSFLCT